MKISALAVAVPKTVYNICELKEKFGESIANRVSKITGVKERHVAEGGIGATELILSAARAAIERAGGPQGIDAILVVTQTAEYKFPATACIIQDELNIDTKVLAYDINLGCSGYVYGLITANSFIKSGDFKKILLIAGELTNSTASSKDSSTYPLFGDAYSATILEPSDGQTDIINFDYGTDGSGKDNLITYIGGSRYPAESEYIKAEGYETHKEVKYPSYCYMNGGKIFEFSIKVVPQMLNNLLSKAVHKIEDIDYLFFHQANEFIINHLTNKLNLPREKVILSLEKYGNTSSASIPVTICNKLGEDFSDRNYLCGLLAFGVGYSWASMLLYINPKAVVSIIEV